MNIQQAKLEIENTLRAYHLRDDLGNYRIPAVHQRPILLMGPPGIGKTAILEQIAQETGTGLVSYTLTHHTRQSAVGLPHIETRSYGEDTFQVTEYTMSEIVAAIYAYMEKTGKQEGILFLDEINCVSETLAPTMLQLLQNKTFGSHKIPRGWILVAAGNPPEYNKSVRDLDIATLDRVRTIEIQPDCESWLSYGREHRIHGAILSYLSIHKEKFYQVEDRAEGKTFVTARGWEDLSEILYGYEALEVPVSEALIRQYIQEAETARAFYACYQLCRKYARDYDIPGILAGRDTSAQRELAEGAGFEERFLIVGLLVDGLTEALLAWDRQRSRILDLHQALLRLKRNFGQGPGEEADRMEKGLQVQKAAGLLTLDQERLKKSTVSRLRDYQLALQKDHIREPEPGFLAISRQFSGEAEAFRQQTESLSRMLSRAFRFGEDCFGEGQEMVLLVTELTHCREAMAFIGENGCDEFLAHSQVLLYRQQEKTLMAQCQAVLNPQGSQEELKWKP